MTPREFWRLLNEPSDFKGDPYAGLLNQIGHAAISAWAFIVACCAWFAVAGEMPPRWAVAWGIAVIYVAAIEWRAQGWKGRDSWIDAGFVAVTPVIIAASTYEVDQAGWVSTVTIRVDTLGVCLLGLGALWIFYAWTRVR